MSNRSLQKGPYSLVAQAQDLSSCNTLRLTCQAEQVVVLESLEQMAELGRQLVQTPDLLALGGGSNVILPSTLSSLVVRVALKGIALVESAADHWLIDVAAGENWHELVVTATARGWWGLENLGLIPGTVGAAPVQNIGAYGVELCQRIESVTAWHVATQKYVTLSRAECEFGYRDSIFKRARRGEWLIVSVRFALPKAWQPVLTYPDLAKLAQLALASQSVTSQTSHTTSAQTVTAQAVTAQAVLDAVCDIRRRKLPDPAVLANAGSFFKNPVVSAAQHAALQARFAQLVSYPQQGGGFKLAAGWLIEHCGFKGVRAGAVGVHAQQALVLVNYGDAQAEELLALAHTIIQTVQTTFGVLLEIEPVIV
jgi:UDP-N-acetylmuramate dehydrogenase